MDRGLNNIQTLTLTPNPSPRTGEGSKSLVPPLPPWEKGLGDERVQSASLLSDPLGYLIHDPKVNFLAQLHVPCATSAIITRF